MKKSLIVAATFAAITLAAANVANAGVAGMLASAPTPTRKSLIRSTITLAASASPQALGLHVASSPKHCWWNSRPS